MQITSTIVLKFCRLMCLRITGQYNIMTWTIQYELGYETAKSVESGIVWFVLTSILRFGSIQGLMMQLCCRIKPVIKRHNLIKFRVVWFFLLSTLSYIVTKVWWWSCRLAFWFALISTLVLDILQIWFVEWNE